MNMYISNGNLTRSQIAVRQLASLAAAPKPAPSALNGPIIGRIHSVKPGCGSCGRH